MYQTTCQKCGMANRLEAVVCVRCGAKLSHPERQAHQRLMGSGVPQMILASPIRFAKWCWRRFTALVTLLFFVFLFGTVVLYVGLLVPLAWPDEPKPKPVTDSKGIQNKMKILRSQGGTLTADTGTMRQLANLLIYDPEYGVNRYFRKNNPVKTASDPAFSKGWVSVYKEGDNFYNVVLRGKWHGKFPLRVKMKFAADRAHDGRFELLGCRIGNLPVTFATALWAAENLLQKWNPDQELSSVCRRITGANMVLRGNSHSDDFSVTVAPAR